jgi:hypothetical protein
MPKQFRNVFVFLNEDVAGVNFMAKKEEKLKSWKTKKLCRPLSRRRRQGLKKAAKECQVELEKRIEKNVFGKRFMKYVST